MKKSKIFIILLLAPLFTALSYSNVKAQDDDGEEHGYYLQTPRVFYGGLLAGANFCQVDGDYYAGYHKVGANFGGIVYAQLAKHLALSLEILYTQKGSKSTYTKPAALDTTLLITKYGINLGYAEVPVMINYFDKRKSHFGVGLSYSRLVSATEDLTTDPAPPPIDLTKYPFKKYDLDVLAGVQLHLVKGLFLNVRFQYSVVPIRVNVPPGFSRSEEFNNLWVVRLMYLFI